MTHDEKPPAVVDEPLVVDKPPTGTAGQASVSGGEKTGVEAGASTGVADTATAPKAEKKKAKRGHKPNNVRRIRIERMMSKAELARRANLSVLTIDRVEKGFGSRMDTKRKILEALGLTLADRVRVFGEEE